MNINPVLGEKKNCEFMKSLIWKLREPKGLISVLRKHK